MIGVTNLQRTLRINVYQTEMLWKFYCCLIEKRMFVHFIWIHILRFIRTVTMIALQFSNLWVRWSARASKQNKKIHPPVADTVVDAQINVLGLPGARLRCFWVVLTAGQSVKRPRRDFDNTLDLSNVRRVRIKLHLFSFPFRFVFWIQELAARPLLNFLPNHGALVES